MHIEADDILAALLLSLAMLRRLESKTASAELNPHVPSEAFAAWQAVALRGYGLLAAACALKVVLNLGWRYSVTGRVSPWVLSVGGLVIFAGWVVAAVTAWRWITDARHTRHRLNIVVRRSVRPARR